MGKLGFKEYKRREIVSEPPAHKVFNGKRYEYHRWHWTEKGVLREIKKLRASGYFARSVIVDPGWATYKRKRKY